MKKILHILKSFWLTTVVLWAASMAACMYLVPRQDWARAYLLESLALVSALFLLAIVLRQYQRIRTEHNLENLVQKEVDKSVNASGSEMRDQQVLAQRLKHAINLLRADRSAGGGGAAALNDLPWYLVVGESAAGKTSLLTHSGLSASMASGQATPESGTQYCDWYFSPDAVLVDTAGRYLKDDSASTEFSDFLRNLKKQRRKCAVNGIVLVVSLPDLLSRTAAKRQELAQDLTARIQEYSRHLQESPPVYLILSKIDQLPGFEQAFGGLDLGERQQPLGMTFGLNEIPQRGLRNVLDTKLENLQVHVRRHVDAQINALGADANSALLDFPSYFNGISEVLEPFLEHFTRPPQGPTVTLRGLYFTSAVQTGAQLPPVHEDALGETFSLQPGAPVTEKAQPDPGKVSERSFFITNTFRQVIFPDRDLTLYHSQTNTGKALNPTVVTCAVLVGVALIGWQAVSFKNNRDWVSGLDRQLGELEQSPDKNNLLASGQGLQLLREQLLTVEKYRANGVPLKLGAGLYSGEAIFQASRLAYLEQLRTQALEPVTRQLQVQIRGFNDFAQSLELDKAPPPDTKARQRTNLARGKSVPGLSAALGSTPRSISDAKGRVLNGAATGLRQSRNVALAALQDTAREQPADPAGGLSLSEETLSRLDEHQVASVVEAYNALKLYLILTNPGLHPEAEFVAAALPAAWAASNGDAPVSQQVIANNVPVYVQLLKSAEAPRLARNEQLVSAARDNLKAFMISSSLVDREYLRIQLEASRKFPALTLADFVPLPGRQLVYGSESVPAIFTREVWETFVRPELIKLVAGNLHNETDWVLDGEGGDSVVQKANFIREFMARYKRDFAQAWYGMVTSVGIRHFTDLANAAQQLSLLSDVQNSPVKNLLSAVNDNTQWDLPAHPANHEAQSRANDAVVENLKAGKAAHIADAASSALPSINDGSLAKRFEAVARVFSAQNAEGADSTVMDRYLASLRKLKVRINNIQRSQDVGKSSKQLISETLEGQPSEVTNVRNYVESTVDASQGGLSKALQGLFTLPVQFTWATLRDPAGQQIAKAWAQQIAKPWDQVMAHRYPIAPDSRNEASVKDLQRFVDPESGLLPNFKRNEIGNLAGGEGLGMSSAKDAPLVNPKMVNSIDRASALGQVIASLSDRDNGFEIMLDPSTSFTDIIFTLDGQVQHYRNGKTSWTRFSWPGTTTAPGARLDVVTLSGERMTVFDFPGRWGLLKMSDSAKVEDLDGIQQRFTWPTSAGPVSLAVRNYGGVKMTDLANVKALSALNDTAKAQ
ncbi:type VI secretion protein IcmF/TssM N-terminal domain-containing protein [Pseudomonas eucalypticola]|uniref:ImcF-like family protein n=1 Tax=Pseudomonas eucalypticola TaxID=2599595 RepID=A0A7D5HKR2_9PSED|nr:type VI secretion protein IcmF/TssM N-terminal domain-containing protein [Pseudomonas eucalypticola]QKZ02388.1 ImcF-like family protein [Pseudomonas eucalypticola]